MSVKVTREAPETPEATLNWPVKVPSAFFVHVGAGGIGPGATGTPVMNTPTPHVSGVLLKPAPKTVTVDAGDPEVGLTTIAPTTLKEVEVAESAPGVPSAVTVEVAL